MKIFAIRDVETLKPRPALYPCETCPPVEVVEPVDWPVDWPIGT